jgi:hypothetical protein
MEEDAFEAIWWRRDVATAWVLTRDRSFVQRQSDRGESDTALDVAFVLYCYNRKFSEIPVPSKVEAWASLHRQMTAGKVRTVGEPFEKTQDLHGNGSMTSEPSRDIPDSELISLQPFDEGDEEFLVHIKWSVAHGSSWGNLRGYQRVRLLRSDVMAVFPEIVVAPRDEITLESSRRPLSEEAAYQDWIARHMGLTPPSRDADRDHMRSLFSGITQERLRALRRDLAPPSWTGRGRRPLVTPKK